MSPMCDLSMCLELKQFILTNQNKLKTFLFLEFVKIYPESQKKLGHCCGKHLKHFDKWYIYFFGGFVIPYETTEKNMNFFCCDF